MKIALVSLIAAVFLWIGFLGAISFMEAWLKFSAPGVTLPIGLSVGKVVFNALNKVEISLALIILLSLFQRYPIPFLDLIIIAIPIVLLLLQSVWLLPLLDARADAHIAGEIVQDSKTHLFYIAGEVVKMLCLVTFGFRLLLKSIPV